MRGFHQCRKSDSWGDQGKSETFDEGCDGDDTNNDDKKVCFAAMQAAGEWNSAAAERNSAEGERVLSANRAAEEGQQSSTEADSTGLSCRATLSSFSYPRLEI